MVKIDPLIPVVMGTARTDAALYRKIVDMSVQQNLTVLHNGVVHLTDDAMEVWYCYMEAVCPR